MAGQSLNTCAWTPVSELRLPVKRKLVLLLLHERHQVLLLWSILPNSIELVASGQMISQEYFSVPMSLTHVILVMSQPSTIDMLPT